MTNHDEWPANFSIIENLIARKLVEEGYGLIRGEAQGWAAKYSLTKNNLDGSVALFFRPAGSEQNRVILYQVISEKTVERTVPMLLGTPDEIASAFVLHLEKALYMDLQPSIEQNPEIGKGLLPISTADAQLETIRQSEEHEESAR